MYSAIKEILDQEEKRQHYCYDLIASQNIVSKDVAQLCGSVFTNNALEGQPGNRYYNGADNADAVESLAIESAKQLFGCSYANVQPHCGTTANFAVYHALLESGNIILGMEMRSGGHLSHGALQTQAYKRYRPVFYGVNQEGLLDYDAIEKQCVCENVYARPKLIIAGGSSYPRKINWKRLREIADKIGAILLADICHYAGLIVSGVYPSPFPYAHIATATTNKTLRGPRGAIILWNDNSYTNKINSAVYPGQQGSPMMNVIAAKAQCFHEAMLPSFTDYSKSIISNAKSMCEIFTHRGFKVQTGGTDCHIILLNFVDRNYTGKQAADALESENIIVNKNPVPNDPRPLKECSGIRIGTSAETTKGKTDFAQLATKICDVLDGL